MNTTADTALLRSPPRDGPGDTQRPSQAAPPVWVSAGPYAVSDASFIAHGDSRASPPRLGHDVDAEVAQRLHEKQRRIDGLEDDAASLRAAVAELSRSLAHAQDTLQQRTAQLSRAEAAASEAAALAETAQQTLNAERAARSCTEDASTETVARLRREVDEARAATRRAEDATRAAEQQSAARAAEAAALHGATRAAARDVDDAVRRGVETARVGFVADARAEVAEEERTARRRAEDHRQALLRAEADLAAAQAAAVGDKQALAHARRAAEEAERRMGAAVVEAETLRQQLADAHRSQHSAVSIARADAEAAVTGAHAGSKAAAAAAITLRSEVARLEGQLREEQDRGAARERQWEKEAARLQAAAAEATRDGAVRLAKAEDAARTVQREAAVSIDATARLRRQLEEERAAHDAAAAKAELAEERLADLRRTLAHREQHSDRMQQRLDRTLREARDRDVDADDVRAALEFREQQDTHDRSRALLHRAASVRDGPPRLGFGQFDATAEWSRSPHPPQPQPQPQVGPPQAPAELGRSATASPGLNVSGDAALHTAVGDMGVQLVQERERAASLERRLRQSEIEAAMRERQARLTALEASFRAPAAPRPPSTPDVSAVGPPPPAPSAKLEPSQGAVRMAAVRSALRDMKPDSR